MAHMKVQCCIVGGGPAGMMLGYLLARAGIRTIVLEKHADFLRDFRGDTVHPSTLTIMQELGLLDEFLTLPHQKLSKLAGSFGTTRVQLADFSRLKTRANFIAFMPQWDFLNFIARKGASLPAFELRMQTRFTGLIRDAGQVRGVQAEGPQGPIDIEADLVVAADGRASDARAAAGLPVHDIGASIDVLWFRVRRDPAAFDEDFTHVTRGTILITLDRGDYWQCAYVIPKGSADALRARGIEEFRRLVAATAASLESNIGDVGSWDDVKLLNVSVNRLERWSIPGLLCIGDAAHAMSPVGGVGINLAIQDAVATANLLTRKLREGVPTAADLDAVRHRRAFATRVTQAMQVQIQNRVLAPVLSGGNGELRPPAMLRLVSRCPWLQGQVARFVGLGVSPEHVASV